MTPLLDVQGVSAGYGDVRIVHGVSIHVEAREIVTIIGPNGAGKSTLLKAVFGAIRPTEGRVILEGRDVAGLSAFQMVQAGAGFVPQTENVFPSLTIRENLEMGAYRRQQGVNERIDELLDRFPELARRPNETAGRLSGGQRQALAMCRALMLEPRLLLLDEPTAALSPIMREEIFAQIVAIRDSGVAVLMVEQNAREALEISDRGYVLVNGQNALEQSGAEMLANPEVGRLFLGRVESGAIEADAPGAEGSR
ncbi:MAG: ABC transporter ATP-binding protein [Chloroflexi bacterium]|nr:ABC transporter ATP-binding protein [Chloroflexota bacterium]MDA1239605.1 ABC transporter ATP-binding protein [Chloroflexota bacterium]